MNLNLLVAEDDVGIYELIKDFLPENISITYSHNGKNAFEKFQTNKFDMILSDVSMPMMNGIDFLKKVREIDPEIIFVVMSSEIQDYICHAYEYGATFAISKEILPSIEEIIAKLVLNCRSGSKKQHRRHIRQNCASPVGMQFEEKRFLGRILNLSASGFFIECSTLQMIVPNDEIIVTLKSPEKRVYYSCKCKVKWLMKNDDDSIEGFGLEIILPWNQSQSLFLEDLSLMVRYECRR